MLVYSQTGSDTIKSSDFIHYLDCQEYQNCIRDNGDTLELRKSFKFDKEGNLVRELIGIPYEPLKLVVYSYDKSVLMDNIVYVKTDMENVFGKYHSKNFYNKTGLIDSVTLSSYAPDLEYIILDEKDTSSINIKNIKVFKDLIFGMKDSAIIDSTFYKKHNYFYSRIYEEPVIGRKMVRTEAKLINAVSDTITHLKYYYNAEGKKIKKLWFMGNITDSTVFIYDKQGRDVEQISYYKNSFKIKEFALHDSTNIFLKQSDFCKYDSACTAVQIKKVIDEYKSGKLIRYNVSFEYNKDGSITKTYRTSYATCKLTYYRNKNGQIIKTIKYTKQGQRTFEERTTIYQYDDLGRIIKCIDYNIDNDNYEIENRKSENFILFKYNDRRPIKIEESEYIDDIESFLLHFP